MFTHIIVFRVVFEVTFKQLTPFKKKSLPYHTVGIPGGNNSFERFQNYRDIKSTLQLSFSAASCQVTRKLFPKLFSAIALHVQEGATQLKERPLSFFLYSSASFSPNAQSCLFFFFFFPNHIPFSSALFSEQQQAHSILCIIFCRTCNAAGSYVSQQGKGPFGAHLNRD